MVIIGMAMQEYMFCKYFQYKIFRYSVVYHIRHFDFQRQIKKLYTLRMKNPTMNNPQPPFPFPIPTLRWSDTYPTENFMTKLTFFVPNIRL